VCDSLEVNLESSVYVWLLFTTVVLLLLLAWPGLCDAVLVPGIAPGVKDVKDFVSGRQFLNVRVQIHYVRTVFTRSVGLLSPSLERNSSAM
jgi:hypothetical protein